MRRVEDVQIDRFLGVEPVYRSRGPQTDRDASIGRQVQPTQKELGRDCSIAVDPVPNLLQWAVFQLCFQPAAGQEGQRLSGRDHAALQIE